MRPDEELFHDCTHLSNQVVSDFKYVFLIVDQILQI